MADQSMLDNTTLSTMSPTNPHELALQSLCKQLLKSRLFRGFYLERRYVKNIKNYRDVVCLQKSERSLDKMLRDISDKLQLFYSYQNPQMWIGITSGPLTGISNLPSTAIETYLWVELNDLAFVEYWFSIKSIRFRENEVVLKLKAVQIVEPEDTSIWTLSTTSSKAICDKNKASLEASTDLSETLPKNVFGLEKQITLEDFMVLLQNWQSSIKQTVYDFMAEDINKENIKGVLRFLGLLIVAILSGTLAGLKFFGNFTIRLMYEISRLTHALTPIILKIIEVLNKMIGGFYILLAMIWRDAIVNRNQPKHKAIEYNRPIYKSIQCDVRPRRHGSSPTASSFEH